MFALLVTILYSLCFLLLVALAVLIGVAPRLKKPKTERSASSAVPSLRGQRRTFVMLVLSLLLWQVTLFWEARTSLPARQLWLGRINFAAIALTVYLAWRFVSHVVSSVRTDDIKAPRFWSYFPLIETGLLAQLTLLTPLIDTAESVVEGHPVTKFGILFPLYLLHVLGYLAATIRLAFRARRQATDPLLRGQLTFIAVGILATGGIALIANALLPFGFGEFHYCDIGTLSTLLFLLAIAYSMFFHRLFDVRIVIKRTVVGGLLLAFVLGGYSSGVFLVATYLTEGHDNNALQWVVLFLAFSFDPLRRFLERKIDRLLFEEESNDR